MATYTATRAKHATLTAGVVDVVTLDRPYPVVEVINRDPSNDLWVTLDRVDTAMVTPTVGGDGVLYIGPGSARMLADDLPYPMPPVSVVRLVSSGAVAYSVTGVVR